MSVSNFRISDDRHIVDVEAQATRFDEAFPRAGAVLTQVAQGLGDVGDGTFATGPKSMAQYVLGATSHLGETAEWSQVFSKYAFNWRDNLVSRVGWAAGNMVYGILHLATGPETFDVRGVTQWGMSIAMLVALPEGIKTTKVMARGAARVVPALDAALTRSEAIAAMQQNAAIVLKRIYAANDAAFVRAWQNTARANANAGSIGAIEIPIRPRSGDLLQLFRDQFVTDANLQALTQHSNSVVATAAKQILMERETPIPGGYVWIPGGKYNRHYVSPFVMQEAPVTNAGWVQGLDGQKRFVLLSWNRKKHTITLQDVFDKPPAFLDPTLNLDAGKVAIKGNQVLAKLVDAPSALYNARGWVFSGEKQPVVGITLFHTEAWLQIQTHETGVRCALPTSRQFEFVASNQGTRLFGTETGRLHAFGAKMAHFDDQVTVAVDDHRYPAGPFGVHSTGNVNRWMQPKPQGYPRPYVVRGGSFSDGRHGLRADTFYDLYPEYCGRDVGFATVLSPKHPKK